MPHGLFFYLHETTLILESRRYQFAVFIGFLVYECHRDETGEVLLLAVRPECQNLGIGTELNITALERMKAAGMKLAVVGTGGDEGHAPARRSYEKAGYTALPLVRYYKDL